VWEVGGIGRSAYSTDDTDASTNAVVTTTATDSNDCEVCLVADGVSRLCHVATSGSVNRAQTKWNVRQGRGCLICRTDIQMILRLF